MLVLTEERHVLRGTPVSAHKGARRKVDARRLTAEGGLCRSAQAHALIEQVHASCDISLIGLLILTIDLVTHVPDANATTARFILVVQFGRTRFTCVAGIEVFLLVRLRLHGDAISEVDAPIRAILARPGLGRKLLPQPEAL